MMDNTQNEAFSGAPDAMLGRWVYDQPMDYGREETYRLGMDWLSVTAGVEDWGCGGGGAKRFCRVPYTGIDGSPGPETDRIVDLRHYKSNTPGLFMRHILEHNKDWKLVLANALASFKQRMALIMFLDWSDETKVLATYPSGIVLVGFKQSDIIGPIEPFLVHESKCGAAGAARETVFFLEKE